MGCSQVTEFDSQGAAASAYQGVASKGYIAVGLQNGGSGTCYANMGEYAGAKINLGFCNSMRNLGRSATPPPPSSSAEMVSLQKMQSLAYSHRLRSAATVADHVAHLAVPTGAESARRSSLGSQPPPCRNTCNRYR